MCVCVCVCVSTGFESVHGVCAFALVVCMSVHGVCVRERCVYVKFMFVRTQGEFVLGVCVHGMYLCVCICMCVCVCLCVCPRARARADIYFFPKNVLPLFPLL